MPTLWDQKFKTAPKFMSASCNRQVSEGLKGQIGELCCQCQNRNAPRNCKWTLE